MAVTAVPSRTTLRLRLQTGVDENGDPVYVNRSYSNIKTSATDQGLYNVATQIAGLQVHTLTNIRRVDEKYLEESAV